MAVVLTSLVAGLAFGVMIVIGSLYSSQGVERIAKTSLRASPNGRTGGDNRTLLNFGTTSINGGQSYLFDPDVVFRDNI